MNGAGGQGSQTWQRSLARALLILVIGGGAALAIVTKSIQPDDDFGLAPTPALDCLQALGPSSMTLELAGNGSRVACQLRDHPLVTSAPTVAERVRIEARIQVRWDELVSLDARLVIPLYVLCSCLIAALTTLKPSSRRTRWAPAAFLVVSVLLLAGLDGRENKAAQAVLLAAEAAGALDPEHLGALDGLAGAVRRASLWKWALAGLWSAALAWALFAARNAGLRCARVARALSVAAAAFAAVLLGAGTVFGLADAQSLAQPVRCLQAGFVLAFSAIVLAALSNDEVGPCQWWRSWRIGRVSK